MGGQRRPEANNLSRVDHSLLPPLQLHCRKLEAVKVLVWAKEMVKVRATEIQGAFFPWADHIRADKVGGLVAEEEVMAGGAVEV